MTSSGQNSPNAGNATRPLLREIIYLDRPRLLSYASQLTDGLTTLRRLLDGTEFGETISSLQREEENSDRIQQGGKAGANIGITVSGEALTEQIRRYKHTTGGDEKSHRAIQALLEDKVDLDNLLLLTEQQLLERGILRDFKPDEPKQSGLLRFHGTLTFSDWETISNMLENIDAISLFYKEQIKGISKNQIKSMPRILKMISLDGLTAHMSSEGKSIAASLQEQHLSMTLRQLRAVYINQTIRATLLGFLPEQVKVDSQGLPNLSQQVNLRTMHNFLMGESDFKVHPIAIYIELE